MKPIRLFFCSLLVLAAFQPAAWSGPLPRRANIVLIVADGLGAGDLSCYGQTQFQTPHLDALAAQGIRFTNYLAGGLADSAALASLVLGQDTSRLPGMDFSLAPNDITIAQLLKNSGYYTCLLGQWSLTGPNAAGAPWEHGFDEFAGYLDPADAQNPYPDYVWRYYQRFDPAANKMDTVNIHETVYGNTGDQRRQYLPDLLTQWAGKDVKNNQPDMFNDYKPFFLMVDYPLPGNGYRRVPSDAPFSEESWPQPEKNRAALIARLDDCIGQLIEQLNKYGQASNTVIFFTSATIPQKDGGVDPGFFHENTSSNDFHVPLIVYWPGKIPAGRVSGLECSARDFLPTAAALADLKPPKGIDGKSFASALFGHAQK